MKEYITKVKRKLASWGIGNPLSQLLYSAEEIERMRSEGKITEYTKKKYKAPSFREKNKGMWGIQVGKIIINKAFRTKQEAEEWSAWNYKGRGNYRIILLF